MLSRELFSQRSEFCDTVMQLGILLLDTSSYFFLYKIKKKIVKNI